MIRPAVRQSPLDAGGAGPVVRSARSPLPAPDAGQIRVMVVDDSAVIRGIVSRFLENDPEIRVVATAMNGRMALEALSRHPVDVVVLDIEMPVMDGLTALPRIAAQWPDTRVIMSSTLTRQNAETTLRALAAGAADCVLKPTSGLNSAQDFQRELVSKVKSLADRGRIAARRQTHVATPELERPANATPVRVAASINLRPVGIGRVRAIAIGASTGGPQALNELVSALARNLSLPVFVTQHMPPTFTTIFAEHLARRSGLPVSEAVDGEPVRAGRVYVAPGGLHLLIETGRDHQVQLRLSQTPPENFCRPAVDPMFRSCAAAYDGQVLGIILTGMGHDGLAGAETLIRAGGTLIAQDEASSVVWGMPGAVAQAGLCSAVLPLTELGIKARALAGLPQ